MMLETHPYAELFPQMSEGEFDAFCADVSENGVLMPVVMYQGKILDGRHRQQACDVLADTTGQKIEFQTEEFQGNDAAALRFVWSANFYRRHFTTEQKCKIAIAFEEKLQAVIKPGNPTGANQFRSNSTVNETENNRNCSIFATIPDNVATNDSKPANKKAAEIAGEMAGLSQSTVSKAKKVKRLAPDLYEQMGSDDGPTLDKALQVAKIREREMMRQETAKLSKQIDAPTGKYRCIVIDPAWTNEDSNCNDPIGRGEPNYNMTTIADMMTEERYNAGLLAEPDDCHLYMWVTNAVLPNAFQLLEAWGFRYITMLTWCKTGIGVGRYYRNNTEHILFAMKGTRLLSHADTGTWFEAKREGGHSAKPSCFYEMVERLSPGPRLEMFARKERKGWDVWGAEVSKKENEAGE